MMGSSGAGRGTRWKNCDRTGYRPAGVGENVAVSSDRFSRRGLLGSAAFAGTAAAQATRPATSFVDILRTPDLVTAFFEPGTTALTRDGRRWSAQGIAVSIEPSASGMPINVECESERLMRIRLR